MSRRMIETFFVLNDTDVTQAAEENQGAELELLALRWRREGRPV